MPLFLRGDIGLELYTVKFACINHTHIFIIHKLVIKFVITPILYITFVITPILYITIVSHSFLTRNGTGKQND